MDSLPESMKKIHSDGSDGANLMESFSLLTGVSRSVQTAATEEIFAGGGEMGKLMRSLDWSKTPLGPVEQWPQSLRTSVSICLASHFPMLIWWGSELVMLYNDAYRPMLGITKHPKAMGQQGHECWPEIWNIIGPMLTGVLTRGAATWSENQLLLLERNGYLEECYFTFSYSPIRDETGGIGGVFTAVTETTRQVLGERRLRTLHDLTEHITNAKTAEEVCRIAIDILSDNIADIPFALLYLLERDGKQTRLAGMLGLNLNTPASPLLVALTKPEDNAGQWPLEQVIRTGHSELVEHLSERFGVLSLRDGIVPPHSALVLPIAHPTQKEPYGVLIAGISAMRTLDADYRNFLTLVSGEIAAAISKAQAFQVERERAEALAELDRAKTMFFSNVSHEFRTPLTLLLGPIEDALADTRNSLSFEQRERLEIVRRNGLRLLKLVNTLLDFSRIEAGRVQAMYEPTDLATFTAELASVFRSAVEKAGLRLVVDCPPLPELIYVDREMWEKIVLNLLSNALKFTFEGQITVALRTRARKLGEVPQASSPAPTVELEVHDTGIGIPPEELPHLFERFYRVRGSRARTYEGSGIGLSLVQELVRLHGGSVQVVSRVGEGTSFTVTIPMGSAHLPAERIGAVRTQQSTALGAAPYIEEALRWLPSDADGSDETGKQAEVSLDKSRVIPPGVTASARILLADDNVDIRNYLKRLLSEFWTVEAVGDGEAALAAIHKQTPDLVLSDVMMPGLDGFQLLQALRGDPRTRTIPVLLLSARAGEESTVEGLKAGADDYLVKPFSARELIARVGTHLEMARIRQEIIRAREELFSIISHDLKNPLSTIKGYAQLLRRVAKRSGAENTQQLVEGLTRIDATATKMTALINELLDIAYLQTGRPLELELNEIDLVVLAQQALTAYQQTTEQHQFQIETRAAELVGYWDEARLERVLGNLLSNAIKYNPVGGKITIELEQENEGESSWAVLRVHDQGIGIPAADLPYIFNRFYRSGNVMGHIRGTGIGLASVRQIVEQHGGTIAVVSEEGVGTTFTVRLPMSFNTSF